MADSKGTAFELRVVQYNILARSAAETTWFPFAVSRAKTDPENRGNCQNIRQTQKLLNEARSSGGIFAGPVWIDDHSEKKLDRSGLSVGEAVKDGDACEFFDQPGDNGTFGTQILSGSLCHPEALGVSCSECVKNVDTRRIVLSWEERLPLLLARIREHDPDIIFLEEVDADTLDDFRTSFPGFGVAYSEPGCLCLWKLESLVAAAEQEVLRYSDGRKVAVIQPLQLVCNGTKLLAVVTHLHWDPKAPLQLQEAKELLECLHARAELPQLVGGDFNAGPLNAVMTEVMKSSVAHGDFHFVELQDVASNGTDIPKTFTTHCPRGPAPKLTDARCIDDVDNPVAIDYVFAHLPSGVDMNVEALDCGRSFSPDAGNGLPNASLGHGSDHMPVAYRVVLKLQ